MTLTFRTQMPFLVRIRRQSASCFNLRNSRFPRQVALIHTSTAESSCVPLKLLLKSELFSNLTKPATTANFKPLTYLNSDRLNRT